MKSITTLLLYSIPGIALLGLYGHRLKTQWRIRQWQHSLNLPTHRQAFQHLYQDLNGFMLSKQARQKHDAFDYVYGEIEFLPFIALLSLVKLDEHSVFYDLGSGTGKAVLACAMVFPVQKSVGVELLPELYDAACKQAQALGHLPVYAQQHHKIKFIHGDFLEVNLDEATIIFINASALFNPTWEKLCERLQHLEKLTTIITTSKSLPSKHFRLIAQPRVAMSWGSVFAYVHVRKKNKY